jgi:hypothetical protein
MRLAGTAYEKNEAIGNRLWALFISQGAQCTVIP